jgi:hypothetical protein
MTISLNFSRALRPAGSPVLGIPRGGRTDFYEILAGQSRLLIRPVPASAAHCLHERGQRSHAAGRCAALARDTQLLKAMMDLIFIAVIVLFFVVGGLYVRLCEKM